MNARFISKWMVIFGLSMVILTFWGAVNHVSLFYAHTYPFAWYGLIVFLDGLLWWRWNEGLILARPREFVTLLFWSAVFWFLFEILNLRLQNWYYAGATSEALWSHAETYLDFATVLPGMFLVYRLLCRLKIPSQVTSRFLLNKQVRKACVPIGLAMLILPLIYPLYFFPLVWGGFIFLLEPVCAKLGGYSLLKNAEKGQWTAIVRLLIGGIVCGGYWELCNFWSLEKWVYTVPFFSHGKLFEMPYLGFLGFAPFCAECFVMINALYLLRGRRHWLPEPPQRSNTAGLIHKTVYLLLIVSGLFLSEWSYTQIKSHTIDSRAEPLWQILEDISPAEATMLGKSGWRYPKEILQDWEEAKKVITPAFRDRIRHRLELVGLLSMGAVNARLLENAGIRTRKELGEQDADRLFPRLLRLDQTLELRRTALVKRRIVAWIGAAKRKSAIY